VNTAGLLSNRVVLITGSSRGIGRAMAWTMAEAGADIVVHYHKAEELAAETAAGVEARGRRAVTVRANLEEPDDIAALFGTVREAFGGLDVFVANAAATAFKPTLELKPHHFERTFNLIVRSLVLAVQQAVPLMEGRSGRIITVSGHGTPFTLAQYAALGSAKGAVETWTRYLAYELAPRGITANCLSPGVIATDSARYYLGDRFQALDRAVSHHTPLGRMGVPEDVALAAVFLASDLSRFVTGQVLRVDGGLSLTSGPFEDTRAESPAVRGKE
jgi:enoyl-[acyl-carrier protein] reductase III